MDNQENQQGASQDIDEIPDPGSQQAAPAPVPTPDAAPRKAEPKVVLGSESTDNIEDNKVILKAREANGKVTLDHEDLIEKAEGLRNYEGLDKTAPVVALPPEETARVMEIAAHFTREFLEKDPVGATWAQLLRMGMRSAFQDELLEAAVTRPGGDWRQYLQHNDSKLSMGKISIANKHGEKLTGPRAIQHMRTMLHGGTPKQVMLPHTGIWVSMRSNGDTSGVDLARQLAEEKIEMGSYSFGQAFSNYSAISAGIMMGYFHDMIYDSNLKDEVTDYGDIVKITDLPMMAHGAASVIWPNGFNYTRAVLNNAGEKMTAKSGTVNINKLQKIDNSMFSPWQTGLLSQRFGHAVTAADLEKYQSEFANLKGREVPLNENITLVLKVPTINEYLNSGQRWVNGIALMVEKAFALPPTDDARNEFINTHGKATNMRQFAHWIQSINILENERVVVYDDIETIEAMLDDISSMEEAAEKYFVAVKKFIADATVSVIAIPAEEGEAVDPSLANERFPHLIPIDVMYTFFILLVQRVERISKRK